MEDCDWKLRVTSVHPSGRRGIAKLFCRVRLRYAKIMKIPANLAVIRSHWQVENSLHWVLDVTFPTGRLPHQKSECGCQLRDNQSGGDELVAAGSRQENELATKTALICLGR